MASSIASSSRSPANTLDMASLTPWERMKIAKTALIQAEDEEAERRTVRRKNRRESVAISAGESSKSSGVSWELSSVAPTQCDPTSPSSILRRKVSYNFPATCANSSNPLVSSVRLSRSSQPSEFGSNSSKSASPQAIRRRLSKVRFSDDSIAELPVSPRRLSAIEGLHEDLARSSRILLLNSPKSASNSLFDTSPLARLSLQGTDFIPQPLPYPRLCRKASRLSTSSICESNDSGSISSPPSTPLRATLDRSSLGTSPRKSVSISLAPSVRSSFGSITSTLLSSASEESWDLPKGSAYHSLLPSAEEATNADRIPKINRVDWAGEAGLSPRSGFTPTQMSGPVVPEPVVLDSPEFAKPELLNPFEIVPVGDDSPRPRQACIDSIDMLPNAVERIAENNSNSSRKISHGRSDSSLSDVIEFPLPPSRQLPALGIVTSIPESIETLSGEFLVENMESGSGSGSGSSEICLDTPRPDSGVSSFSSAPSIETPPGSPTVGQMIEGARAKSIWDDEPELIKSPLLDAAVSSGILSPVSRKLSGSPRRTIRPKVARKPNSSEFLRSGHSLTSGRGWSGSESEEDEFNNAVHDLAVKKVRPRLSRSSSSGSSIKTGASVPVSQSMVRPLADRLSQLSTNSTVSSMSSNGPLTPNSFHAMTPIKSSLKRTESLSSSKSGSTTPGNFPWGGSAPPSPTSSGRAGNSVGSQGSFYEDLNASLSKLQKKKGKGKMPKPNRKVEGWGRPEVLVDERWDEDVSSWRGMVSSGDEGGSSAREREVKRKLSVKLASVSKLKMLSKRDMADFTALGLSQDRYGSLLNEEMPDVEEMVSL